MSSSFPIIETDRLMLREVLPADAPDMLTYLSDKMVVQHMGLPPFQSVQEVQGEIGWYSEIRESGSGIRWGITLKGEGKVIGSCGFLNLHPKHFRAEVGFELNREYWGQGIAGEALDAVVNHGFTHLNLERIEALIIPDNDASRKLVEEKGFHKEGLLRHYEYTCGQFDDLLMYSLLKGENKEKRDEA
ncbi:GNAT family N-acetyltransferase [Rossellomorea sp. LjRoot5]|uniref:GNAT family N-acetyltransferase n=1 Tax=Rossellomorea sp. LjRoot5 TaxID=3342331 RepID=UPI003ECF170F